MKKSTIKNLLADQGVCRRDIKKRRSGWIEIEYENFWLYSGSEVADSIFELVNDGIIAERRTATGRQYALR